MGILSAKKLTIKFKDGNQYNAILDSVDISFSKGETTILSGPSGCGKSSILYALALLREPSDGVIKYNNEIVEGRKKKEDIRYNDFGFVFQQHFLISYLSVMENICLKSNAKKEDAEKLLEMVGMSDMSDKKIYQLSGGQKQRVAIARALVCNPTVIFADEPTASLDKENAIQIYNLLREVSKDKLLIMATHDKSLLDGTEKVYIFENKKIVEQD
ncbi:MAG: ABC transporter ATP-binding protein [Roseburia sp.]